ncbi:MAG TPA: hypothetical protein VHR47_03845 [Bacillota bacterium]|nr:hypothetical protein [Bacillota bacterium]
MHRRNFIWTIFILMILVSLLAGCGGSGGSGNTNPTGSGSTGGSENSNPGGATGGGTGGAIGGGTGGDGTNPGGNGGSETGPYNYNVKIVFLESGMKKDSHVLQIMNGDVVADQSVSDANGEWNFNNDKTNLPVRPLHDQYYYAAMTMFINPTGHFAVAVPRRSVTLDEASCTMERLANGANFTLSIKSNSVYTYSVIEIDEKSGAFVKEESLGSERNVSQTLFVDDSVILFIKCSDSTGVKYATKYFMASLQCTSTTVSPMDMEL